MVDRAPDPGAAGECDLGQISVMDVAREHPDGSRRFSMLARADLPDEPDELPERRLEGSPVVEVARLAHALRATSGRVSRRRSPRADSRASIKISAEAVPPSLVWPRRATAIAAPRASTAATATKTRLLHSDFSM